MSQMSREWQTVYQRKWRAANREKCNLAAARWKAKNPEKVRGMNLKWREQNPEYHKLWARENRESRKKTEGKWRTANYEQHRVIMRRASKKYTTAHPEKVRIQRHRRRERIRNAKPCDKQSANLLCQLISNPSRLKCGICGKNMPKNDRTIDHVIPLSKGGSGEIWNLRIVHLHCNLKKAHRMPDELNFHAP